MQKLRKLVPKDRADLFGVVTTLVLLVSVLINDLIQINANKTGNELNALVVLILGLFIAFNAFSNLFKAMSVDTSIDAVEVQIKQLPEWRFCSHCELYAPPRSYHCFTCNKCILKRHNHCLFMGTYFYFYHLFFLIYVLSIQD